MESVKLYEFTKEEWWDVGRRINPDLTWEEFEEQWAEFEKKTSLPTCH